MVSGAPSVPTLRCSGRIPTATRLPSYPASEGAFASTDAGTVRVLLPNFNVVPPPLLDTVASSRFICGEPMKAPTKRLSGWS